MKYDLIISNDEVMGNPKKYLKGDEYSLEEICDALGIDTIWPIVHTIRNYVKSYGDKYYYSFRQNVPDEMMVDFVKAVYKYIKIIFNDFKPDVILAPNIISLPHIMMNIYAKRLGIKMIAVSDCKIRGYHVFSYDFCDAISPLCSRIDALNSGQIKTENRARAKKYIQKSKMNLITPEAFDPLKLNKNKESVIKIIRRELSPYKQVLRWYIKGPPVSAVENIGISRQG